MLIFRRIHFIQAAYGTLTLETVRGSSGETTVFYVTLGTCYSVWMTDWYAGWNGTDCAPNWFYLQDYTELHGQ